MKSNVGLNCLAGISFFLVVFSLTLMFGPWNGSDYTAYTNEILCQQNVNTLCVKDVIHDKTISALSFSQDQSLFTSKDQLKPSEVTVTNFLPSQPYSKLLSYLNVTSVKYSVLLTYLAVALITTFLVFTNIQISYGASQLWPLTLIALLFNIPIFSHSVGSAYPAGVSCLALLTYLVAKNRIRIEFLAGSKFLKYTLVQLIAISLIMITRFEVTFILCLDLIITSLSLFIAGSMKKLTSYYLFLTIVILVIVQRNIYFKNIFLLTKNRQFSLQPVLISETSGTSGSRFIKIITAPLDYYDQLVYQPWIRSVHLLSTPYALLICLALFITLARINPAVITKNKWISLILKILLLIALPAASRVGAMRLMYILPFVIYIAIEFIDINYDWRYLMLLLSVTGSIINWISTLMFSRQHPILYFESFAISANYVVGVQLISLVVINIWMIKKMQISIRSSH